MSALRELFSEAINQDGVHGDVILQPRDPKDPKINHAKRNKRNKPLDKRNKPDPYAQKFALALSTGKLPNLSQMESPEATIAEADRVLAVRPEAGAL